VKAILFVSSLFVSTNSYSAPIPDALTLNGLTWAQLQPTVNIYLPDVYEICGISGGTCSGSAGGVDFTGWRWASQNEVDTLISDFFGIQYTHAFRNAVPVDSEAWFDVFQHTAAESTSIFTNGFSSDTLIEIDGWIDFGDTASIPSISYDLYNPEESGYIRDYVPFIERDSAYFYSNQLYGTGYFLVKGDYLPPSPVPAPSALFLFAPALLGLMGLRRKLS